MRQCYAVRAMSAVLPGTAVSTRIRLSAAGRIVSWPDTASALFGRYEATVRGEPFTMLLEPGERLACEAVLAYLAHDLTGQVRTMSIAGARPDGATVPLECSMWRTADGFELVVADISDRARLEDALRQEVRVLRQASEEQARELAAARARLADITETIDEVFWIADSAITRMLYISPAYERIWGRSCQSLYDSPKSFIDAIYEADRDRIIEDLRVQRNGSPLDHEYRVMRPDGSIVWIWDRGFPVFRADGSVDRYIGVAQDISERKAVEAAARRQETLDAIGHMAGGLAHDFNNVLGMVIGHLDLLALSLPGDWPQRESLDSALDAAMRGERLARRLLALARSEPAARRPICLASSIESLRPLLAYAAGPQTELEIAVSEGPAVNVDPAELDAAMINLAVNARAAMPAGGRLTITLDAVTLSPQSAAEYSIAPGRYASLAVADTGCGMTPQVVQRVCEPFFTTRGHQAGTGLGLTMVHAFVRQSGGTMRIDSTPGIGSRFELLLPAVPAS